MAINNDAIDFEARIELHFKECFESRDFLALSSENIEEYCEKALVTSSYDLLKDIKIRQAHIAQFKLTQNMKEEDMIGYNINESVLIALGKNVR